MLQFTKLTLNDIDKIKPFLSYFNNKICDNTVGGAFMWRDYFETEYVECNNTVIFKSVVKYHHDVIGFSFPFWVDFHCCLDNVVEYCRANKLPVIFFNVVENDVKKLKDFFCNNDAG